MPEDIRLNLVVAISWATCSSPSVSNTKNGAKRKARCLNHRRIFENYQKEHSSKSGGMALRSILGEEANSEWASKVDNGGSESEEGRP